MDFLTPVQCRMARSALGWSLDALAAASGMNRRTILRFEQQDGETRTKTISAIRRALERGGIRFIDEGEFAGGIAPPEK